MNHLITVAEQFCSADKVLDIQEHGSGNLNDTFLVTLDATKERRFILQRINTRVFSRPELIVQNMRTFSEHVSERLKAERSDRRWEVPRVLLTKGAQDFFVDSGGSFWRALSFIEGARTFETIQNPDHAREAGYALGRFQSLISDLDVQKLHDTLEGFHITPQYLRHYDQVLGSIDQRQKHAQEKYCLQMVAERKEWASILEDAKSHNKLLLRPIHGDAKINNMLMDETTGQAVSIIDLDTVKPGLVHYDIGDCLRSCCNPLGEETTKIDDVRFEIDLCRAILQGYLSEASRFLNENDYAYLYDSIRLIAFELGLRFFTDYLEGNVYFKAADKEHNLVRALVQFRLTQSIEAQEADIRTIINDLRPASAT